MAIQTINSDAIHPFGPPNVGTGTEFGDSWEGAVTKLNAMLIELYAGGPANRLFTGLVTFQAGTLAAGTNFRALGTLQATTASAQSSGTNTTQTLLSYTLPANVLDAVGRQINVSAWGATAGNAASKTIALNIGGTSFTTGTQTGSGYSWILNGTYIKTAANTQDAIFSGDASGIRATVKHQTDTSVDTGTIAITVTMADGSAATSNVTLYGFTVEYFE